MSLNVEGVGAMNGNKKAKKVNEKHSMDLDTFAHRLTEMCLGYIQEKDASKPVINFFTPEELQKKLELQIQNEPAALETLLKDCQNVLDYSVNTGHIHFFNQLFAKMDIISLMGEWLTSTLNASMYTFEIAPVFVLMEKYILEKMGNLVGFHEVDGIFAPGGSISNLYAVRLALHKFDTRIKFDGLRASPHQFVLFTSAHSHYSLKKSAILMGLGMNNVILVDCDDKGRMLATDLEKKIKEAIAKGHKPFFVNATAGSTVFGAYDKFDEIADVCEKYKLWMHIDGAWGASVLLSEKYKHVMNGCERADSITWNPHKMMSVPLQCSAFVTKHTGLLADCNSTKAGYLFQPDKGYDVSYDTGDKAIQCGRKVDVFKLWLAWKAKGDKGFDEQITRAFDNALSLVNEIKKRRGQFELVVEDPQCTNVCFWYIPPSVQNLSKEERKEKLHRVAPTIKLRMQKEGTTMVGYQPLFELPNFWRMIVINPELKQENLIFLLDEIARLGKDLQNVPKRIYLRV